MRSENPSGASVERDRARAWGLAAIPTALALAVLVGWRQAPAGPAEPSPGHRAPEGSGAVDEAPAMRPASMGLGLRRPSEIDLVETYRTSSEDPCLMLRRQDDPGGSVAMVVRLRGLDRWILYAATCADGEPLESLADPAARMRWRASRHVRAVALSPAPDRVVEAAARAWDALRPPASAGSVMSRSIPAEEPSGPRSLAARRTAR